MELCLVDRQNWGKLDKQTDITCFVTEGAKLVIDVAGSMSLTHIVHTQNQGKTHTDKCYVLVDSGGGVLASSSSAQLASVLEVLFTIDLNLLHGLQCTSLLSFADILICCHDRKKKLSLFLFQSYSSILQSSGQLTYLLQMDANGEKLRQR
jgi:hypothetical protein